MNWERYEHPLIVRPKFGSRFDGGILVHEIVAESWVSAVATDDSGIPAAIQKIDDHKARVIVSIPLPVPLPLNAESAICGA